MPRWLLMAAALAVLPSVASADAEVSAQAALQEIDTADFTNAYRPFARHALSEAAKRERGRTANSAVLVERVSLADPKAVPCAERPLAAVIDLDVAPGTPAEMDIEPQSGFAWLLDIMRGAGIRIAWLADSDPDRMRPITDLLSEGETPVFRADQDLLMIGWPGVSKQDVRQRLAQSHCVVAIAGDRKADFDELYDYLRDESYAIRLEGYMDRGWFLLPHPVVAIDSERLKIPQEKTISPEQKVEQ